jgi:hypothetical protein
MGFRRVQTTVGLALLQKKTFEIVSVDEKNAFWGLKIGQQGVLSL